VTKGATICNCKESFIKSQNITRFKTIDNTFKEKLNVKMVDSSKHIKA